MARLRFCGKGRRRLPLCAAQLPADALTGAAHSLEAIAAIAKRTVEGLPEPFRTHARDVAVQITEWPPGDVLQDLAIDDPLDLTGLYEGTPLTQKSLSDPCPHPDVISLYRAPILHELSDRPGITLDALVTHVVIHEFAHHFGWSDADIARVDQWWA